MFDMVTYGSIGLCVGAFLAYATNRMHQTILSTLMALSTGMIMGIVFRDFLPEAVEMGGVIWAATGTGVGFLIGYLFDRMFHEHSNQNQNERNILMRSGILIGAGIALHNLPAGLLLGSTFIHLPHLGRDLGMIMFLHNVPEGMAMGIPLAMARVRPLNLFLLVVCISLPFFIGALLGAMVQFENVGVLAVLIGLASGTIVYVSWFEVFLRSMRGIYVWLAFILFVLGYYLSTVFL